MTLYLDTSALLKLYVEEAESGACEALLNDDRTWFTGGHTIVEVRRNLARLLDGDALVDARAQFERDWAQMNVLMLDQAACEAAAEVAEQTGTRSLDALHIAAALRVPPARLSTEGGEMAIVSPVILVTYDTRLAAAESYDLEVAAPGVGD